MTNRCFLRCGESGYTTRTSGVGRRERWGSGCGVGRWCCFVGVSSRMCSGVRGGRRWHSSHVVVQCSGFAGGG